MATDSQREKENGWREGAEQKEEREVEEERAMTSFISTSSRIKL